jgi:hypothetical protein
LDASIEKCRESVVLNLPNYQHDPAHTGFVDAGLVSFFAFRSLTVGRLYSRTCFAAIPDCTVTQVMTPTQPVTFYSNIANVKITGNELVFEFGAVFPANNQPQAVKSVEFAPEVRVVLGLSALKAFSDILQKAVVQMEGASSVPQQQTPGNRPESKQ